MSHELLSDSRLFMLLVKFDQALADDTRRARCPRCGSKLHSARFPRKPRGGPPRDLKEAYTKRDGLCCAKEGCRKRQLPPSVRFLGRRHYLGAIVVLTSAMRDGLTARRAAELNQLLGVSIRTLRRWRAWWLEAFAASAFWQSVKARFSPPVEVRDLPASLLNRFVGHPRDTLVSLLKLLAPITTGAGLAMNR